MEYTCLIGESDMSDFTLWWESHLPACIIIYCRSGEAELKLQFKSHRFRQGMVTFISPDMYPHFVSTTKDFKAFYCLMSRDFAEKSAYNVPNAFFDGLYAEPMLPVGTSMEVWMGLLGSVYADRANLCRQNILIDLLHAFTLDCYNKWKLQYGDRPLKEDRSPAEAICIRFYNLVFDHFKEHRNTAFYADKLCITPNYLAMVTRQICHESPKQVIDRQVTLEMKYILQHTEMTAEQIAHALHFPDTSYMCRFFRRQTGCSLSEYRKNRVTDKEVPSL